MKLLDYFRSKPKPKALKEPRAVATEFGPRTALNPLTAHNMTPQRLLGILTEAECGEPAEFFTYAKAIEKRDLHYGSVLGTRKTAIRQLPVKVIAASESTQDEEIAEAVREYITGDEDQPNPQFGDLIANMLDALGKGVSFNEILWDTSGPIWHPGCYEFRDPRWFRPDRITLREHRLIIDGNRDNDEPLEAGKWVVHEPSLITGLPIEGGLARGVAAMHLLKSIAVRDWAAFVDVFGIPIKIGVVPDSATDEQKDELLDVLRQIGADATAVITQSMKIELSDGAGKGGRGSGVHEAFCSWVDKQVSKYVIGQTMTVEDGSSLAQAAIHDKVRGDIRDGDAVAVTNTVNRCVVAPFIAWNFGKVRRPPRIVIRYTAPEDIAKLAAAIPQMVKIGLPVEASVMLDRFGLQMPEPGALILTSKGLGLMPTDEEIKEKAEEEPEPDPEDPEDDGEKADADPEEAAYAARGGDDEIDRQIARIKDWRHLEKLRTTIIDTATSAETPEQFAAALEAALGDADLDEFVDRLAVENFKMRGLGDASDAV